MSNPPRNAILAAVVLLGVACLCLAGLGAASAGVALLSPRQALIPAETALPTPVPLSTRTALVQAPSAAPTSGQAGTPAPGTPFPTQAALSPAITRQMDQIEQQVTAIRGLKPTGPLKRTLITRSQLNDKVVNDFFKDYTPQDARNDETTLAEFGLLPAGFDPRTFYEKLYAENIAGFYDPKTKEMYVVADQGFEGPERLTYAHEYTHALQDENFDLEKGVGFSDTACKADSERCAAVQALIEGDATVVEQDWLLTDSTPLDRQQIQASAHDLQTPVYNSAPAFMQQDFLFPYRSGQEFVQSLLDRGGWAQVNTAFRNPPVSTEQILHPDRYPGDRPVTVTLPDLTGTLGPGWTLVSQNPMGEWYTYLILAYGADPHARLSTAAAQTAAEGWGGDEYAVYADGQAVEGLLISQWDTSQDASEFLTAFTDYGTARWGAPAAGPDGELTWQTGSGLIYFQLQGQRTTWIMSPDQQTQQAVLAALAK